MQKVAKCRIVSEQYSLKKSPDITTSLPLKMSFMNQIFFFKIHFVNKRANFPHEMHADDKYSKLDPVDSTVRYKVVK